MTRTDVFTSEELKVPTNTQYFGNMSVEMSLHGKCVVCGADEDFNLYDENENAKIFKNKRTSFCNECAIKFARKILAGLDF